MSEMRGWSIWTGVLVLALGVAAGGEEAGWEGALSLRWNLLTERNGVAPDYQDLRGGLRLVTPAVGQCGARLHLDARVKEGLEERFAGPDNPYEDRRQVRRAFVEVERFLGGRLQLGRHLPEMRGVGAWSRPPTSSSPAPTATTANTGSREWTGSTRGYSATSTNPRPATSAIRAAARKVRRRARTIEGGIAHPEIRDGFIASGGEHGEDDD